MSTRIWSFLLILKAKAQTLEGQLNSIPARKSPDRIPQRHPQPRLRFNSHSHSYKKTHAVRMLRKEVTTLAISEARLFFDEANNQFFQSSFIAWIVAFMTHTNHAFSVNKNGVRAVTFGVELTDNTPFGVE